MVATVFTAILVFWLAYDDATFGLVARSSLAIAVWWAIAVTTALGVLRPPSRLAFWGVAGLLAAFAAWTAASMAWAASNERAFNEFNRVSLYVGSFVLAALLAQKAPASRWADGVALGGVSIAVIALGQRCFPDALPAGELSRYTTGPQLSYPIEYVNGLAIFLALSLPLLLRAAVGSQTSLGRAAAVAPIPALAGAMYLTSSRGSVIVAAVGVVAFLALTGRRWATAGALALAAAGSAGAVAVLAHRPELVDEPLTRAAEDQGPGAALLIAVLCLGTALVYLGADRLLRGVSPAPVVGWMTLAVVLGLAVGAVAAADPVEAFDTFRKAPNEPGALDPEYTVRGHLLSANSTGRWQFWKAAGEQFEEHPTVGDGAGSYEAWWARHGSFAMFITDAHSLYLETLGELGVIGFLLLVAALGVGAAAATRQTLGLAEPAGGALAALTACFLAYLAAAALDWMWELTVVSVVGFSALGWALGDSSGAQSGRLALRIVLPAVAVLAIVAQAIPLASTVAIRDSQAAVDDGALAEALDDARAARDVQPWAASPHLQLALVLEETGQLRAARGAIRQAIERDRNDWRLWLVRARLETKAGAIQSARRSLRRAAALNPRSPLFPRG
jgi:tetratricopeptide (TPR) repeat protein